MDFFLPILTRFFSGEYLVVLVAVVVLTLSIKGSRRKGGERKPPSALILSRTALSWAAAIVVVGNIMFLLPLTVPDFGPAVIVPRPWEVLPGWTEYALIPAMGAVSMAVILITVLRWARRARRVQARGLDPRPRQWWTFAPRRWLVTSGVLLAFTAVTIVVAGLVADEDEHGRSIFLTQATPGGYGASDFPGWYYGTPVLIAVALLALIAVGALILVARSPLPQGPSRSDVEASRRHAAGEIVVIASCALALTLGRLWIFVALAGGMTTQVVTDQGEAFFGTPYAAVAPLIGFAGALLAGSGVGVLLAVILRPRNRAESRATADSPSAA